MLCSVVKVIQVAEEQYPTEQAQIFTLQNFLGNKSCERLKSDAANCGAEGGTNVSPHCMSTSQSTCVFIRNYRGSRLKFCFILPIMWVTRFLESFLLNFFESNVPPLNCQMQCANRMATVTDLDAYRAVSCQWSVPL